MSFSQQSVGNCCGAWCVTHYLSLTKEPTWASSDTIFVREGRKIWNSVKFKNGDGADPAWVKAENSDPWKMIDALKGKGVKAGLWIELAAKNNPGLFKSSLVKLEGLTTGKNRTIWKGNISGLFKGGYAIAVMYDVKNPGLHYLLVHRPNTTADLQLYDPRSDTLTWENHSTFSFGGTVKNKPTIEGSVTPQSFTFLGVYIKIETS